MQVGMTHSLGRGKCLLETLLSQHSDLRLRAPCSSTAPSPNVNPLGWPAAHPQSLGWLHQGEAGKEEGETKRQSFWGLLLSEGFGSQCHLDPTILPARTHKGRALTEVL